MTRKCTLCKGDRNIMELQAPTGNLFYIRGGLLKARFPHIRWVPCPTCNPEEFAKCGPIPPNTKPKSP